jgi:hypothetical protein
MDIDLELQAWRSDWQTASAAPVDLTRRVERETRSMRRYMLFEILITVVFGGGTIVGAALATWDDALVLTVGVWIFIGVAWTMSMLLRRGAWAPITATTAAFLELSILRCQRRREAVLAQAVLYVTLLSFLLWWIYGHRGHEFEDVSAFLASTELWWVWLVTVVLAALAARQRQRLGLELDALTALRDAIERPS